MSPNDVALRAPPSPPGLVPASMMEAMKLAEMMSSARLVPQPLQKSPADCLMVVMQAIRWQMDPFAVAQECSVIQGKLMHSGKLVAGVVNARGGLAERLSFTYAGQPGDARTITVRGRLQGESEVREVTVRLGEAKTANKVWQSQPDQQLAYHGARVWARRHTPELMLGVYSPEEFDEPSSVVREPIDVTPPAAPVDTAADLDAFAADALVVDEDALRLTAEAAAMKGTEMFRAFWAPLSAVERDLLRPNLSTYQAVAATADATRLVDEERARDEDPFGLPPLGEAHAPDARKITLTGTGYDPGAGLVMRDPTLEPVTEAPAVPFAAAVRSLVPVAGDDGELDWRAWSEAFVALIERASPADCEKLRISSLPAYGKCRGEYGDGARAIVDALAAKTKAAEPAA